MKLGGDASNRVKAVNALEEQTPIKTSILPQQMWHDESRTKR